MPIRRGHVEGLEAELAFARAQIADLQAQLRELGVEPRTVSSYNSNNALQPSNSWLPPHAAPASSDWAHEQRQSPAGYAPASGVETTEYRPLPEFKPASIGDNYVGVSSADSLLSHIKGTSLSIFGTELDITDYLEESDADYDNSELSYNHFLRVILGEDKTVEFVPYHDYPTLHTNATWYIRSMNPYTMLLDKPTFMRLVRLPRWNPELSLTMDRFGALGTTGHTTLRLLRRSACT